MPKGKLKRSKLEFAQKLVLNQWLISLFGVDPLADGYKRGEKPFHKLAEHLRTTREGLDADGLHHFYHELKDGDFFRMGGAKVSAAELQQYEENIVSHTAAINLGRAADRQIKWKYFQWPTPFRNILWMPKPLGNWLEENHVLFLEDTGPVYLPKLFKGILEI